MKKLCPYLVCAAALLLFAAVSLQRQQQLAAQLIRFHVVANSDRDTDQTKKLEVRDALLPEIEKLTAGCTSREEAAAILAANAKALGTAAAETAGEAVTLCLSPEHYETRHYGSFSLPAGEYLSFQVRIGKAEGKNWWCVAFPSVCTAATAEEMEAVAVSGGLGGTQLRMMTSDEPDIEVRYLLLEWIAWLRARF